MYEFDIQTTKEQPYLYVRLVTDYDHIGPGLGKSFSNIIDFMEKNDVPPIGNGLVYFSTRPHDLFRMHIGYLINRNDMQVAQGDVFAGVKPAGRSIHFRHHGHFSEYPSIYATMAEYCRKQGLLLDQATWQYHYSRPYGTPHEQLVTDCHQALIG